VRQAFPKGVGPRCTERAGIGGYSDIVSLTLERRRGSSRLPDRLRPDTALTDRASWRHDARNCGKVRKEGTSHGSAAGIAWIPPHVIPVLRQNALARDRLTLVAQDTTKLSLSRRFGAKIDEESLAVLLPDGFVVKETVSIRLFHLAPAIKMETLGIAQPLPPRVCVAILRRLPFEFPQLPPT
jgi:hypothetical protein